MADEDREEERGPRLVTSNDGLAAVNVGKSFKKRPVLRGVSVTLQRGEAVGLLGARPNLPPGRPRQRVAY